MTADRIEVELTADTSALSDADRRAFDILVQVVRLMDKIYLRQREEGFYPADLTAEEFMSYVAAHPEQKAALESPFTLVRRSGNGLKSVPYAEAYRSELQRSSNLLRQAALATDHPGLRIFLMARAEAFVSNDYTPSEILWIGLTDAPIEATLGPYEEYDDKLMGLKRSFEGVLGVSLSDENQRLGLYQSLIIDFDRAMGERYGYQAGSSIRPMVVIEQALAGGFTLRHDFTPRAYSLPNDEEIRRRVGAKQVFLKNVVAARLNKITRKIAERIFSPSSATAVQEEPDFLFLLGHELAHGLGLYCKGELRELGHPLEEAKADVFGLLFLKRMRERGVFSEETLRAAIVASLMTYIRSLRVDEESAHGLRAKIQLQWLCDWNAVSFRDGLVNFDEDRFWLATRSLANEFAALAMTEDYARAQKFIERWGRGDIEGLSALLEKVQDVPLDIEAKYVL